MEQGTAKDYDIIKYEVSICNNKIQKVEILDNVKDLIRLLRFIMPPSKRDDVFDEFLELCETGIDCSYFDNEVKIEIKKLYFKISEV